MSGTRRKLVENINNVMVKTVKDELSRVNDNSAAFVLYLGILWQKLLYIL